MNHTQDPRHHDKNLGTLGVDDYSVDSSRHGSGGLVRDSSS